MKVNFLSKQIRVPAPHVESAVMPPPSIFSAAPWQHQTAKPIKCLKGYIESDCGPKGHKRAR